MLAHRVNQLTGPGDGVHREWRSNAASWSLLQPVEPHRPPAPNTWLARQASADTVATVRTTLRTVRFSARPIGYIPGVCPRWNFCGIRARSRYQLEQGCARHLAHFPARQNQFVCRTGFRYLLLINTSRVITSRSVGSSIDTF